MCLAIPALVVAIDALNATVDLAGVRKDISIALVPEVVLGDYVLSLIHI